MAKILYAPLDSGAAQPDSKGDLLGDTVIDDREIEVIEEIEELENRRILTKPLRDSLKDYCQSGKTLVAWGFEPSAINLEVWESIREDDWLIGLSERTITQLGYTYIKTRNMDLALLFSDEEGKEVTTELILFIRDFESVWIPSERFNKLAGYKEDFIPRYPMIIAQDITENIISRFKSVENLVDFLKQ